MAHVHRERVELADGTAVTAVSFLGDDPYARAAAPAFGLYLDDRWDPPWPHDHVAWPDFGLPPDVDGLRIALVALLDRPRRRGGREGAWAATVAPAPLACLAVLTGTPATGPSTAGQHCSGRRDGRAHCRDLRPPRSRR
jgi:hypothetical protein